MYVITGTYSPLCAWCCIDATPAITQLAARAFWVCSKCMRLASRDSMPPRDPVYSMIDSGHSIAKFTVWSFLLRGVDCGWCGGDELLRVPRCQSWPWSGRDFLEWHLEADTWTLCMFLFCLAFFWPRNLMLSKLPPAKNRDMDMRRGKRREREKDSGKH